MAADEKYEEEYSLSEFEDDEDDSFEEDYLSEQRGVRESNTKKTRSTAWDKNLEKDGEGNRNNNIEEEDVPDVNDGDVDGVDAEGFTMQTPEMLLAILRKEDDNYLEFESLKINRIKCLGLCKIIFGQRDWRTAEAHLQLGEAYFKGKYYHEQCLKHVNLARAILLEVQSKGSTSVPSLELQNLLQSMYLLLGKTNSKLGKYKVSENCLHKAKLVSDKTKSGSLKFVLLRVSILSALGDTLSMMGDYGQSVEYIEEAIELVQKMPSTHTHLNINLYKQTVNFELMNEKHTNLEAASDCANKALDISIEVNGNDSKETAELFILVCKVESLREISDYEKIESNINKAMDIYKTLKLPEKEIVTLKMHCKVLMQQEKLSDAKSILDEAISKCETNFDNCSIQAADLYELMGSLLFAQKKLPSALNYFSKAADIFEGKRKCAAKQERLNNIIEIIRKSCKDDKIKTSEDKLKERPRFA